MSATTKKDYITFAAGINTEVNYIKEEEGTCIELSNFKIKKDGSIQKRGGLLPSQSLIPSVNYTDKPQHFLWKNINGNPDDNFYVVKQGMLLHFFKAEDNLSTNSKLNLTVDLVGFTTIGYTAGDYVSVSMVDGDGYLFVVGKKIEPIIIKYEKDTKQMVANKIELQIRDYVGLEDNIKDVTEYPLVLSDELSYNLSNQGFKESDIMQYFSENGCLPAKVDMPKHFKYIFISTDLEKENFEAPREIIDYQLSFENNFGTTVAPIGRKLLNIFKQDRKISGSKIVYNINTNNVFAFRLENNSAVITFKNNRVPDIPINTFIFPNVTQTGTDITFPPSGYNDTQIGYPSTRYTTPMVVNWDRQDTFIKEFPIFHDPDTCWNASPSTSKTEYTSYFQRRNDNLMARNTGENNEYVVIYTNDNVKEFVKKNLEDIGGVVQEDFLLPTSWGLPANEQGHYMRITTNAKKDNLFNSRRLYYVPTPTTYEHVYDVILPGTQQPTEVTEYLPAVFVKSKLNNPNFNSPDNQGAAIRYISNNMCELWLGTSLINIDDTVETLPQGYNAWSWNTHYENGLGLQSIQELLNQMRIEYVISADDVDISKDEEPYRPESIAFFANRIFYSSYDTDLFSNHIFYSQMQDIYNNAGKCYMRNDPTSEYENNILATDGGYLTLPEADKILDLVVVKDKLIALCDNAVYSIYGNPFFQATNYAVMKIADVGMAGKGAYSTIGETIVFASHDGLYTFNIDDMSGNLLSNNFSNKKIKTLYSSLTKEQRANIKIKYNEYEKTLNILLNKDTSLAPDVYDTILIYDFDLEAFYMYDIEQYGDLQILDFFDEYFYNRDKPNSLLYYNNLTGDYGTLNESSTTYKDFDVSNPNNYPCSLETNYINFNDVIRMKSVKQLQVWTKNEDNSYCEAFVKYDSSIISSSKWSKAENIFRLQPKTKGTVHYHQQVCRGNGLFFKLRFESNEPKPCHIIGWSLTVTGNQQI